MVSASTQEKSSQRLVALDGIRGLAIFLVIFNHIPLGLLYGKLPVIFHPFLTILLANGKTGVSLLFLLSGFLMTWLYPQPKSAIGFWAKRYARVFPPFLVMVASLAIIRSFKLFLSEATLIEMSLNPWLFGLYAVPIILGVAVVGRLLWEIALKINKFIPLGKAIFLAFLLAQVGVALWYVFILLRVPPAVFYQSWSLAAQMAATTLVNATLTLQFGQYIAQLDGVYWSLITEVSFYLLYPIFIVPLVGAVIKKRSPILSVLLILSFLPFLFGLKLVLDRVLGFSIMQIHLAIYFITGIVLALILRVKEDWRAKLVKMAPVVTHPIFIVIALALLFSSVLLYSSISKFYHPWVQLFWAFPIGFAMYVALLPGAFGRWLESPFFAVLGRYSYSLYLTHSIVIEILIKQGEPDTLINAAGVTLAAFAGSLVLSKVLYHLIEVPYFNLKRAKVVPFVTSAKEEKKLEETKPIFAAYSVGATRRSILALTVVVIGIIYIGYRSLSAFFTQSIPHNSQPVNWLNSSPRYVQITETPTRFEFIADADNLGMITTSLKSGEVKNDENVTNASSTPGEIQISLLDSENQVLAKTQYKVHEIGESRYHPFGFPVIPDSKGKKYALEYQIVQNDPARSLVIEASDAEYRTLYVINKAALLKNPRALFEFTLNKVIEPFMKPSSLSAAILFAPFLVLLWLGFFRGKSS